MRGGRLARARQLDASGLRPPDHSLLVLDRKPFERVEVVDPPHREDVSAACPGLARRHDRHVGRPPDRGVRRAVDEAGDVPSIVVRGGGPLGRERRDVPDGSDRGAGVIPGDVGPAPAEPEPGVVLRGRRATAVRPDDLAEGAQ
jgi:hypothetical protein